MVDAGDEIMASLFMVNSTQVTFLIANHTTGEVCTPFTQTEPSSYLAKDLPGGPVKISGATGEWITEQPVNWTTGKLDRLPFYEPVVFEDCHVVLGFAPKVGEVEEQPLGTMLINSTDTAEDTPRTATVSVAKRHGLDRFGAKIRGRPTKIPGGAFSPDPAPGPSYIA
jgi:hypothetical protein